MGLSIQLKQRKKEQKWYKYSIFRSELTCCASWTSPSSCTLTYIWSTTLAIILTRTRQCSWKTKIGIIKIRKTEDYTYKLCTFDQSIVQYIYRCSEHCIRHHFDKEMNTLLQNNRQMLINKFHVFKNRVQTAVKSFFLLFNSSIEINRTQKVAHGRFSEEQFSKVHLNVSL